MSLIFPSKPFSSCVVFNSFPQLLRIIDASECLRHSWFGFSSGNTVTATVIDLSICPHHDHCRNECSLVCGCMLPAILANNQSALLDKLFLSSGLVQSNSCNITSQYIFFLCMTFTTFCTSFLTTKTHCPLLCKQEPLTHK